MADHGCINGTLDATKYSSPVPVIGLYIAAATLVCLLLMIYDTLVGFYTRKCWLPCKIFKLDSITLTLVSISVKLTVDLTTPMPNVIDQLSKLCGTCLLCVYMGFIMPSVGVMIDSTNMYSLSILVITVFVNICIQISTGVVVLFIPQHIIVLCLMILLLGILWFCVWKLKNVTNHTRKRKENFFRRSKETVLEERLKICYLYDYGSNTQFIACKDDACFSVGGINLFCLAILIHAAYRSVIKKSEKFCVGNSDYDWSMPTIVVTQIITVILGSSVSIYRWLTLFARKSSSYNIGEGEPYESNPIWEISTRHFWEFATLKIPIIINVVILIFTFPVAFLALRLQAVMENFESGDNAAPEGFKYLIEDSIGIDEWTLRKGLTEMEKERKVGKREPNELFQLLSKITPSQQLQVERIWDRVSPDGENIPVSTLSVVLLIRIAQVSLPKDLNSFLVKTFSEVFEFLCFIEKNLYLTSPEFAKKLEVAKAVWLAPELSHLVAQTFDKCATGQSQSADTNCALAIITEVIRKMPYDMIYSELSIIESFINRQQYSSIKELYNYIEQLYVDMLNVMLAQFPTASFRALTESPSDDYHKSVKLALKFICKIELLKDRIQWKFPQGSNLLRLMNTPVLVTEEEESNAAVNNLDVLHTIEDTVTVPIYHDESDVIIEVEDSNLRTVS